VYYLPQLYTVVALGSRTTHSNQMNLTIASLDIRLVNTNKNTQ